MWSCRSETPRPERSSGRSLFRASRQSSVALRSSFSPASSHRAAGFLRARTGRSSSNDLRISWCLLTGAPQNRLRQPLVDFAVPRNGLLAFAVRPNVVAASRSQKMPAALGQTLLEVAPLHWTQCTPNRVRLLQRQSVGVVFVGEEVSEAGPADHGFEHLFVLFAGEGDDDHFPDEVAARFAFFALEERADVLEEAELERS